MLCLWFFDYKHQILSTKGFDWFFWCSEDRKSTRLNSSHRCISYAVFCLKKKKLVIYALTALAPNGLAGKGCACSVSVSAQGEPGRPPVSVTLCLKSPILSGLASSAPAAA